MSTLGASAVLRLRGEGGGNARREAGGIKEISGKKAAETFQEERRAEGLLPAPCPSTRQVARSTMVGVIKQRV